MRLAFASSYTGLRIPDMFKEQIKKDSRNMRIVLAECLDNLPINCNSIEYSEFIDNESISYYKYSNDDPVCFKLDKYNSYELEVIDVDVSKPWRVCNYDGIESIEYYPNKYKVVDKELNICDW